MYMVTLNEEKCTGCDSCAAGCPAQILAFDGEHAVIKGDPCDCMGCEACVMVCPAGAFTVQEL
ncbi:MULTISPECIES: 4Fe-4S dicluster domain-containing protein [Gordonibacter]|uniref:4Fe-4S dicluster domain-containing protein n=1 Tax=Gordonibacter faecis TaxID=3047475 RepID=A0ABT7DP54_9ACTN|nr:MULTISPECIES: 4Fe-4S binding protein [unclassified Gordonibacter]MDJ1650311.1 4Fe-4S dicluster domain-containing protein [Gordonibacter sp. KGMB12511]HIW76843.1 4Fe-4S dicluster domain-containing protein [Candidatus Gordonibacter avicola]